MPITRLHVRYDAAHFPEDPAFRETEDRENFQVRYILRHPFKGDFSCDAAKDYRKQLAERQEGEAQTLATLTGWNIDDVRKRAGIVPTAQPVTHAPEKDHWWERMFK